jgi:hypothetical protein
LRKAQLHPRTIADITRREEIQSTTGGVPIVQIKGDDVIIQTYQE